MELPLNTDSTESDNEEVNITSRTVVNGNTISITVPLYYQNMSVYSTFQ